MTTHGVAWRMGADRDASVSCASMQRAYVGYNLIHAGHGDVAIDRSPKYGKQSHGIAERQGNVLTYTADASIGPRRWMFGPPRETRRSGRVHPDVFVERKDGTDD